MSPASSPSVAGIGMTSARTRRRLLARLRTAGIRSEQVLEAMARVPRHEFVDEAMATRAYEDTALPIGRSQTISQPYVVALMTEAALAGGQPQRVLEVGTGSGYQAAVLAQLVDQVFTVERIDELSRQARRRFRQLRLRNIRAKQADGYEGWPQNAPFDAILVTAAAPALPEQLIDQLAPGGVLVAPVGPQRSHQRLKRITRHPGGPREDDLGGVVFVPMLPGLD